jgi:phosphoribosylamine--glycine ligase
LEGSKAFLKQLCRDAGVPTAEFGVATSFAEGTALLDRFGAPYVIKTDGLAAGKGVLVTADRAEAEADLVAKLSGEAFGPAGRRVVIEEGMQGRELSVFALCNGKDFVLFPVARDYKRLLDGDRGPNTGGMGSIAPVVDVESGLIEIIADSIIAPTLDRLTKLGIDYRGILYAGCMLTHTGPRLIEYNVRFGDPEAEVVLPLVASGLGDGLLAAALGEPLPTLKVSGQSATTVVVAAPGYPDAPMSGLVVEGIEDARALPGVVVFAAGLGAGRADTLVTAGGRVLAVTGVGRDLAESTARAYAGVRCIGFDGLQYRHDIGS